MSLIFFCIIPHPFTRTKCSKVSIIMQMLAPGAFFNALKVRGVTHFFGVPDPILKYFCAFVASHTTPKEHIITANEGNAVAMAAGYHLATGGLPLVYMKNSGLGDALNPLISLTHAEACSIPMFIVVGWRGAPDAGNELPCAAEGRLTEGILRAAEVPYIILSSACGNGEQSMETALDMALKHVHNSRTPYAFLVPPNFFEECAYEGVGEGIAELPMTRREAVEQALRQIDRGDIVVGAASFLAREIFEVQECAGMRHGPQFFPVGSMGHCSSVAAGIALAKPERQVFCFDGDGAFLMHMGSSATIGGVAAIHLIGTGETSLMRNYKHVVFNNGSHDSAGGQPTVSFDVSLTQVASACGFRTVREEPVMDLGETVRALQELKKAEGPAFLEVFVRRGGHSNPQCELPSLDESKQALTNCLRG
ncbi:phosphonopyruvate decarboxylase-like protein, putative [Trypanosoma brucei brucei TREU927]|uniref:Phosphonopyruvate decarboxylase-like protein, putative n=2 Tax=Trypanozoon TaxID=39700 RepID=Q383Z4_TRYB2|nr:phosphonopyruvate decarboxylase-like protein, putative [Trypanosoma brucei brucei TREU927]EAN79887.1 phosphonopyruvate decarboxylase-like protein, putative [Trypanosoma brucei brucei TREU927]